MKIDNFQTEHYDRHNKRRQEHLASLRLKLSFKSVLEVGAGIGDHTSFFIDRGCQVTSVDGRKELIVKLNERYPQVTTHCWDVEKDPPINLTPHDIVYAYGILYHTKEPSRVISNLSSLCKEMLLLETCVSFGEEPCVNVTEERLGDPTQALEGLGCRPTRIWIFNELRKHFPYVYNTASQPHHEEFPLDWTSGQNPNGLLSRSVFVASRAQLTNDLLSPFVVDRHI